MNLKEILAISGTPGLFRYVAQSKGGIIVETLDESRRRQIVSGSAKVSALGDIAIFTRSEEVSLGEVFEKIRVVNNGKEVAITGKSTPAELIAFLEAALPDFDRERVHNSDIKKLAQWYNILIAAGVESFDEKEEEVAEVAATTDKPAAAIKAAAPKKPTAVKAKTGAASSKPKVAATKNTTARKSS